VGPVSQLLDVLGQIPPEALLVLLSLGAFLENVIPPIPADTFVVVGGLLAARESVPAVPLLVGIWLANTGGALAVYALGYRGGRKMFETRIGRRLLTPRQLERITRFYRRWGVPAILLARFLPGLRAVVPAFAGVSHLHWTRVVPPVLTASAVWYGALLWMGMQAEGQVARVEEWLASLNQGLLVVAVVLVVAAGAWWWTTRREEE
jgi:membrane-associated protein